ncbi:MAG: hypothetical protein ACRDQX_12910, partial [Pseudonocardiaceae bacterium]
ALLNIVVLSALAALHTLVLVWVFDPARSMSVLAQMLLAGMITLVMLLLARPIRRMWQMTELAVAAVGGALPAAPPGALARLRRRTPDVEATASERFWQEARGTEADSSEPSPDSPTGSRVRPEASAPVLVAAERLDRRGGAESLHRLSGAESSGRRRGTESLDRRGGAESLNRPGSTRAAIPAPSPSGLGEGASRPDRVGALPAGFSVNTTDRARAVEDPVYVPSAFGDPRGAPRQADLEEVAGRPVWVVYRPSAGLEVGVDSAAADSARTAD